MKNEVAQRIGVQYYLEQRKLRGFGNGVCEALGKQTLTLTISDVDIMTEVLIVPDDVQTESILIGQTALDQPGIRIVKEPGSLTISRINDKKSKKNEGRRVMRLVEYEDIRQEEAKCNPNVTQEQKDKLFEREVMKEKTDELLEAGIIKESTSGWIKFNIEVKDESPVNQRPYRLSYAQRE
ncbi:hypothetical protein CBL_20214, partial [Carabus blaptoides fortunei]